VHRCRQNVIKRTRATAGREREREGGGKEAREGGMHRCHQNVIKLTPAPVVRVREGEFKLIIRKCNGCVVVSGFPPKAY